jgi:serine protease Do
LDDAAPEEIVNTSNATLRAVTSLILLVVLAGCSPDSNAQLDEARNTADTSLLAHAASSSLPDFTALVREYGDAVVNVQVQQRARRARSWSRGPLPDDPFFDFFRRFGIPGPEFGPRGGSPLIRGTGSGFIVSRDGYILTNAHVVADADEVTVKLTDRREFQAKVVGVDTRTDVAVIKIEAKDLPTVRIGNPDKLAPGQWVLAIGSPFGLENSVTAGIVSATSRSVGGDSYVPFIQTDVAVNPGNSGGPLFNLQGEVIGINSMIFSRTGGYMGLSFAIPIDVAMNVRDQLVKTGHVVRGRIGVAVQDVNAQLAQSFGLDRPRGALVSSVEEDGPAAKAGIKPGDLILSVNGQKIERFSDLSGIIANLKPGTDAELKVWRDHKEREINVRTAELEDESAQLSSRTNTNEPGGKLGIAVRPLTAEEKRRSDTEGSVVVEQVASAAAEAGVRPGDIILGVNGERVDSVRALRKAVDDAPETVALLIQRGDAQIFVPVPTG